MCSGIQTYILYTSRDFTCKGNHSTGKVIILRQTDVWELTHVSPMGKYRENLILKKNQNAINTSYIISLFSPVHRRLFSTQGFFFFFWQQHGMLCLEHMTSLNLLKPKYFLRNTKVKLTIMNILLAFFKILFLQSSVLREEQRRLCKVKNTCFRETI